MSGGFPPLDGSLSGVVVALLGGPVTLWGARRPSRSGIRRDRQPRGLFHSKAAYAAEITAFQATKAGQGVTFSQSFGSSGTQATDVVDGLPADVVNFSTTLDMDKLVQAGLVSANWDKNNTAGMVTNSIVSFIVRKGNPLHVKTWADLVKSGIQVVTPNPFSSGSAKWNLLAAYGAELAAGQSKSAAKSYLADLLKHTVSQPSSASLALQAFLSGQGNVLLDYQDDADYAVSQGEPITVVTLLNQFSFRIRCADDVW